MLIVALRLGFSDNLHLFLSYLPSSMSLIALLLSTPFCPVRQHSLIQPHVCTLRTYERMHNSFVSPASLSSEVVCSFNKCTLRSSSCNFRLLQPLPIPLMRDEGSGVLGGSLDDDVEYRLDGLLRSDWSCKVRIRPSEAGEHSFEFLQLFFSNYQSDQKSASATSSFLPYS